MPIKDAEMDSCRPKYCQIAVDLLEIEFDSMGWSSAGRIDWRGVLIVMLAQREVNVADQVMN